MAGMGKAKRPDESSHRQNAASSRFLHNVRTAVLSDPGLPRPNPTVAAWQVPEHPTMSNTQSPTLPTRTDFAIIGSGITGCSTTRALLQHHDAGSQHITVFEARTLVSGATGRNGGHLVTAAGHTYGPLARQHGVEAARQITRFSILNINAIIDMVEKMDPELQEACQFRHVLKVMAVGDDETWATARQSVLDFQANVPEHSAYHRIVQQDDVPDRWNIKDSSGAVEHKAGAIWPYRLLTSMYEQLLRQYPDRLSIETNTPVTHVRYSPETDAQYPYELATPRGRIRARRVIHCTNGHASHLLPALAGGIYPFRGTMTEQKPGPRLANLGASRSWSLAHRSRLDVETGFYDTGLYYLQQNARTGNIWIGNETAYLKDILTSDDTYVPAEARRALSRVLPRFFKEGWQEEQDTSEIESIWSGIQGHTADGLPVVGRVPACVTGNAADDQQWIAAGFNGYGMDKCWLTGVALAEMVLGQAAPGYFPRCYVVTEERLRRRLNADETVRKFAGLAMVSGSDEIAKL
ncbi:FAD dependent oxidoreductase-domain-containing protein [Microdochium bolleyi]|uniref:FAD dependent oxidoreductase-domain-containing protein n=1 Tax=Microdochium bolleyi TaxID=196109 RepID=A0A136IXH1_9PEZI|nr:FAD dependent oxidoreductase-domain-containing protein [Microdochium bolleyi]